MQKRLKRGRGSKRQRRVLRDKRQRNEKLFLKRKEERGLRRRKRIALVLRLTAIVILTVMLSLGIVVAATNIAALSRDDRILDDHSGNRYDCIVVLGAGVRADGTPSDMLADRLDVAIELYQEGASDVIVISGDCDPAENYDEVTAMEKYCLSKGVPASAIVRDERGFSTYESVLNLKNAQKYGSVLIVTQRYHLYRALYIAEKLGFEAKGADAALRSYRGQLYRDVREIAARTKDCFLVAVNK